MPLGKRKNYLEFNLDYTTISGEPLTFSLDNEKYPELENFDLIFSTLTTINLKAKFVFGIKY